MNIKKIFSKLTAKKLYLAIGGVLLVAVVAGAMILPGTLFRGLIPTQYNPGVVNQLITPLRTVCTVDRNPAFTNQEVTFTTTPAGGKPPYTYTWTSPNAATNVTSVTDPVLTTFYDHEGNFETRTYVRDANGDTTWEPCDVVEVNDPPPLLIDCDVDPSPVITGSPAIFTGVASGGVPPYRYVWIDTNLPQDPDIHGKLTQSISLTFDNPGSPSNIVAGVADSRVQNNGKTKVCQFVVQTSILAPPPILPVTAGCAASPNPATVGEEVTWTATAAGGSGSFDYVWYDTSDPAVNGKTTQSVKTTYTAADDSKSVNLIVTDQDNNALSDGATCDVAIEEAPPQVDPLIASCSVVPTSIGSGDTVTWTANASGGDGSYTYLWAGDKIDNKTTKTVQAMFTQKPLTNLYKVIVSSAGQLKTVTCPTLTFVAAAPPVTPPVTPPDEEEEEEVEETGEPSKCPGVNYPVDIDGHWAEDYIKKGYDYCLFKGVGGKFFPDRQATRIEAASMILYSKDKNPSSTCTTLACLTPFNDLQDEDQGAILNPLYFESLIEGYPNNQFRPQTLITRAEGASLIVRAFFEPFDRECYDPHCGAGWPDNFFLDITETWQGKYIRVLWDLRIMTGAGPNKVEPNRSITRAEMAKMIVLAYEETH